MCGGSRSLRAGILNCSNTTCASLVEQTGLVSIATRRSKLFRSRGCKKRSLKKKQRTEEQEEKTRDKTMRSTGLPTVCLRLSLCAAQEKIATEPVVTTTALVDTGAARTVASLAFYRQHVKQASPAAAASAAVLSHENVFALHELDEPLEAAGGVCAKKMWQVGAPATLVGDTSAVACTLSFTRRDGGDEPAIATAVLPDPLLVIDDLPFDLIIGSDLFWKYEATIDFSGASPAAAALVLPQGRTSLVVPIAFGLPLPQAASPPTAEAARTQPPAATTKKRKHLGSPLPCIGLQMLLPSSPASQKAQVLPMRGLVAPKAIVQQQPQPLLLALVDTGAVSCAVDSAVAPSLPGYMPAPPMARGLGAGGSAEISGIVPHLSFALTSLTSNSAGSSADAEERPLIPSDSGGPVAALQLPFFKFIAGSSWLVAHRAVISYKDKSLTFCPNSQASSERSTVSITPWMRPDES